MLSHMKGVEKRLLGPKTPPSWTQVPLAGGTIRLEIEQYRLFLAIMGTHACDDAQPSGDPAITQEMPLNRAAIMHPS